MGYPGKRGMCETKTILKTMGFFINICDDMWKWHFLGMFTLQFTLDKRLDHLEELIHINLIFGGPGCELYDIHVSLDPK